jgi:polyribonucleotide nucleotidyltransferase
MQKKEYEMEIGGKTLTAEFSDLTDQANGSVILRYGNTVVLATAVMSKHAKEGAGWFPLTVDYEEKFYAAGQILGSRFMRREGRPTDEAILTARVTDRTIRPLFEQYIRHDIQVVVTVLSIDKDDPDILAINAASLALATSDIPWNGPVSAVRVAKRKSEDSFVINPGYIFRDEDDLDFEMVVCGKDGNINMIEAGGKEIGEDETNEAFKKAILEIEKLQEFQKQIISEIGKEKTVIEKPEVSESAKNLFKEKIESKLPEALFSGPGNDGLHALGDEWNNTVKESLPEENTSITDEYFEEKVNELMHKEAITSEKRADGRKMDEVRDIYAQAGGVSPILHGSGIFYRGGTHVLSALTLGGPKDSQIIDGMEIQTEKRFMHHYNFPPYSSGETGRIGGTNRRMIGHGALAEKALSAVLPPKEEFPYTIRIVSESMASNGSTSMASVCGGTLALMDAGVPIKAPVAGIAMGLMMQDENTYKVLTDIQGPEDHHGDMDFKVAGTRNGIAAIQMDVKVDGIPVAVLAEALADAKKARLHILDVMEKELEHPRKEISPSAPKIISVTIKPEQIGMIIGPGGKTVNKIREDTGAEIDIEDDGTVYITGKNGSAEKARDIVEAMTHEYKAGEKFEGEVTKILDFGAFVKIGPNTEGLVHISEIAPFRVEKITDVLKEGDIVPVVVKEIDDKDRINLSIKQANPDFIKPTTKK